MAKSNRNDIEYLRGNKKGSADTNNYDESPRESNRTMSEREDMWLRTEGKGTPGGYEAMGTTGIQDILGTHERGETRNPDEPIEKSAYSYGSGTVFSSKATESDIKVTGKDRDANKEYGNAR